MFIEQKILEYYIQHIRMLSEGSCNTEDWSNDAENPALNKLHFTIY